MKIASNTYSLFGPPKMAPDIVAKLNALVLAAPRSRRRSSPRRRRRRAPLRPSSRSTYSRKRAGSCRSSKPQESKRTEAAMGGGL
jgi:hypothetical protein